MSYQIHEKPYPLCHSHILYHQYVYRDDFITLVNPQIIEINPKTFQLCLGEEHQDFDQTLMIHDSLGRIGMVVIPSTHFSEDFEQIKGQIQLFFTS